MKQSSPWLTIGLATLWFVCAGLSVGCASKNKKRDFELTQARFYLETPSDAGFASATLPLSGVRLAISSGPVITEIDIVQVRSSRTELGPFIAFQLRPDAARDLYRLTGANQGKRLLLMLNDQPAGVRMIDRPFSDGVIAIYPEIPEAEIPKLLKNLNGTAEEVQKEFKKNQ